MLFAGSNEVHYTVDIYHTLDSMDRQPLHVVVVRPTELYFGPNECLITRTGEEMGQMR